MSQRPTLAAYMHVEGFDSYTRLDFNKRKIRAAMRKAGRVVAAAAQMNIALARGSDNYPVSRTGELVRSIDPKVSRSGFMVKIMPTKTGGMAEYYPAYLYYGVRQGGRVKALAKGEGRGKSNRRASGQRAEALAARQSNGWRIAPRANYMVDALQATEGRVREILTAAFASSLI